MTVALPAQAEVQVSVDFFHDQLEEYGDWREIGDYGYCWQPRDVDPDWRPYSDGRWLYTDAGWTFDSAEPYSWAVHHYGRWARVESVGWFWVPGTEWGPAWVSWRRSPRHVGWAPLPPDAEFNRGVGFNARVDADYDIGPDHYRFVEARNFGAPRLRTVMIAPRENLAIVQQTRNITRISYVNNVVYNEGPDYAVISRESARPIRRLKLDRREQFDGDLRTVRSEQLRSRVEGDSLRVAAMPFDQKPAKAPRKLAARVEKAEVDRGWKNAGPPAEVEKLRRKIRSEPARVDERSPEPKAGPRTETPVAAEIPAPVTGEKPARETPRSTERNPRPVAPVAAEAAEPAPGKRNNQPRKSEAPTQQTPPGAVEAVSPPAPPKKSGDKVREIPRRPAPDSTEVAAPPRAQKRENPATPRRQQPDAVEAPARKQQREQGEVRTRPGNTGAPNVERKAPNPEKQRPQQATRPPARKQQPVQSVQTKPGNAGPNVERKAAKLEKQRAPAARPQARPNAAATAAKAPAPQPAKGQGKKPKDKGKPEEDEEKKRP